MRSIYIFTGENKDVDGKYRKLLTEKAKKYGVSILSSPDGADALAVLGGDGTILRIIPTACKLNIPVIGVNLGRIGYMAELDVNEDSLISEFFKGNFYEEKRMTITVESDGAGYTFLNDAVIHSHSTHMIRLSLYCNEIPVNTYRGDGLIITTPTGSTAYSMSAGGSIIDPTLECIGVTPICTQALMAKPLIFAPDNILSVLIETDDAILTVDGGNSVELRKDTKITFVKSNQPLRMIKLKNDGFFGVLRRKFLE